jgi:hypothetical protein
MLSIALVTLHARSFIIGGLNDIMFAIMFTLPFVFQVLLFCDPYMYAAEHLFMSAGSQAQRCHLILVSMNWMNR